MHRARKPFPPPPIGTGRWRWWVGFCWLAASLPCLAATPSPTSGLTDALRQLGPWGPLAFIALFVLASVLCLPVVFLNLAAGALFGVLPGLLYAWIGAQIGANAAFFISRRIARQRVARLLARRPLLHAVSEAVGTEGWKVVGLLRLAPGSPFFLLNYLFGVTRVRFRDYFWATAFSIIPGTLFFVYLGSLGQRAASGELQTLWERLLHGVGLLALLAACTLVGRRAKAILRSRLPEVSEVKKEGPEHSKARKP